MAHTMRKTNGGVPIDSSHADGGGDGEEDDPLFADL
jgi:hypothetical protein